MWQIINIDNKNRGPRIEPCGTPVSTTLVDDNTTIEINVLISVSYVAMKQIIGNTTDTIIV